MLDKKERKKFRIRNKIKKVSSVDRYRLSVSRSTRNISVQIIDDKNKKTLISKSLKKNKKELSSIVAENIAKKAKDMKITKVYFDRGIYKYHGRIKLLAEELRKHGMEF